MQILKCFLYIKGVLIFRFWFMLDFFLVHYNDFLIKKYQDYFHVTMTNQILATNNKRRWSSHYGKENIETYKRIFEIDIEQASFRFCHPVTYPGS